MIEAAYVVEVNPASHELKVELRLEGIDPNRPLLLATPTWVPGAYGFMKYGRDMFFDVKARDSAGKPLVIQRQEWAGYTIAQPSSSLALTHTSYAYDTAWESWPAWWIYQTPCSWPPDSCIRRSTADR